jgi:hypothetical protein
LVEAGLLVELDVQPALPNLEYVAVYKANRASDLIANCVELAKTCCDFSITPIVSSLK